MWKSGFCSDIGGVTEKRFFAGSNVAHANSHVSIVICWVIFFYNFKHNRYWFIIINAGYNTMYCSTIVFATSCRNSDAIHQIWWAQVNRQSHNLIEFVQLASTYYMFIAQRDSNKLCYFFSRLSFQFFSDVCSMRQCAWYKQKMAKRNCALCVSHLCAIRCSFCSITCLFRDCGWVFRWANTFPYHIRLI